MSAAPPPDVDVATLGESGVIDLIRARVPPPPPWVVIGLGDDAAVVEPVRNALEVVTADGLVESVHFERALAACEDLGCKALAVNLSDLAAMGAEPRSAVLSLALPGDLPARDLAALVEGFLGLAAAHRVALVGGNVTRSPLLGIDVTAIGSVHRRRILTRAGGRAGDELFVTGTLGAAAAGLDFLRRGGSGGPPDAALAGCLRRYQRPDPRLRAGRLFGRNRAASACVDLSDGLADAIRQLARASGTGAVIEADAVPIDPGARRWFEATDRDPLAAALGGGEDYELLLAVPARRRRSAAALVRLLKDLPVTRIGVLTEDSALLVRREGRTEALPAGFQHF